MAKKKRLNTKLISVLILIGIPLLLVFWYALGTKFPQLMPAALHSMLGRDSATLLAQGQEAMARAKEIEAENRKEIASLEMQKPQEAFAKLEEMNKEEAKEYWTQAHNNLWDAHKYCGSNVELRQVILENLVDMYISRGDYKMVRNIRSNQIRLEGGHAAAQRHLLEMSYESTQLSPNADRWTRLDQEVQKYIDDYPEDAFGYAMQAHAKKALLVLGVPQDEGAARAEFEQLLEKTLSIEENNILAHRLKSEMILWDARQSDTIDKESAYQEAEALLVSCIEKNPEELKAYENYFNVYLKPLLMLRKSQIREAEAETDEQEQQLKEQYDSQFREVVARVEGWTDIFPAEGEPSAYKAELQRLNLSTLNIELYDEIIDLYRKALEKEPKNVDWLSELAQMHISRANQKREAQEDLEEAYQLLRYVQFMPEAQIETAGPQADKMNFNRYANVLPLLVYVSMELHEQGDDEAVRNKYFTVAESAVKELQENLREQELPFVKLSAARVSLAKGETDEGLKLLYDAAKQIEMQPATRDISSQIYWELFKALRNTDKKFLAVQYAAKAFQQVPHPVWDYGDLIEILSELPGRQSKALLLQFVDRYDEVFAKDPDHYQRAQVLKARALYELDMNEECRKVLDGITVSSRDVLWLRAQTQSATKNRIKALHELFEDKPDDVETAMALYDHYYEQGQSHPAEYDKARAVLDRAIEANPDNINLIQRRLMLDEADPADISQPRREEIAVKVFEKVEDPFRGAKELGDFYLGMGERRAGDDSGDTAKAYFVKASECYEQALKIRPKDEGALYGLFSAAVKQKQWQEAERIWGQLKEIQPVEAKLYQVRMLIEQDKTVEALSELESYLEDRPLNLTARVKLAQLYINQDRLENGIDQLRQIISMDQNHVEANRLLAIIMHRRNQQKGYASLNQSDVTNVATPLQAIIDVQPKDVMANEILVTYQILQMSAIGTRLKDQDLSDEMRSSLEKIFENLFSVIETRMKFLLESNPDNVMNWPMLARVYQNYAVYQQDETEKAKGIAKAKAVYDEALQQFPDEIQLHQAYGAFLKEIGQQGSEEDSLKQFIAGAEGRKKLEAMQQLGRFYYQQNRYQEAIELMRSALREFPDDLVTAALLADILFQTNQRNEAIELYGRLYEQEQREFFLARQIEAYIDLGREEKAGELLETMKQNHSDYDGMKLLAAKLALIQTHSAEAVAYADQILKDNPQNKTALLFKAQALYQMDDNEKALQTLQNLRKLVETNDNSGRLLLSHINWNLGYYNDAVNILEEAVKYEPDNPQFHHYYVQRLRSLNRWSSLEAFFDRLIERQPENIRVHVQAGQNALSLGDHYTQRDNSQMSRVYYQKASNYMQKALTLSQQNDGADLELALDGMLTVLKKTGNYDQMLALANQYLDESNPSLTLLLHKAEATHLRGRQSGNAALEKEAIEQFETIIRQFAEHPSLDSIIAGYCQRIGTPDSMVEWARRKLAEKPDWAVMHIVLARMYGLKGQVDQQVAEYEKVYRGPDDKLKDYALNQLSIICLTHERWSQAIEYCRQLVEKFPESANFVNNLAYALMQEGQHIDEALTWAKKAYDLDRTDTDIMDTYAIALLEGKDYDQAELIAMRAIQEKKRSGEEVPAEYEYHLCQALIGQDRQQDALERLERLRDKLDTTVVSARNAGWLTRVEELIASIKNGDATS